MSSEMDIQDSCKIIERDYTVCDISDALLKLKVPGAGFLPDFSAYSVDGGCSSMLRLRSPVPEAILNKSTSRARIVAPLSTVLFVSKSLPKASEHHNEPLLESNIPKGLNWTDCPAPGSIVIAQQPKGDFSVALLGDIMTTRLHTRGLRGVIVDGRLRDISSCASIREGTGFQLWSKGVSAAGPSLELKSWAVDVPLDFGQLRVQPGDIVCADEEEKCICVIPRDLLVSVLELLPILKKASVDVLEEVSRGSSLPSAIARHPDFYSNYK